MVDPLRTTSQHLYQASTDNPVLTIKEKIAEITKSDELLGKVYAKVAEAGNKSPLQGLDTADRLIWPLLLSEQAREK